MRHRATLVLILLVPACSISSEPGERGPAGPPGATTVTIDGDSVSIQQLADIVAAQQQTIAQLQTQLESDPQCPAGYMPSATLPNPANINSVLCTKGVDEVVKVGTRGSAFWIDRYEASVWENADGSGMQHGASGYYPASFPQNGQRMSEFVELYAVSRAGATPSAQITWFQANEACRASGKRLPSGSEWLAASSGTEDPESGNDGQENTLCKTACVEGDCPNDAPRATGGAAKCASAWGAEDMIGNLWEWTDEWYAGLGSSAPPSPGPALPWPNSGYGSDATWNIASQAVNDGAWATGLPGVGRRGGSFGDGTAAGIFALDLSSGPSHTYSTQGFRCVVRR